MELSVKVAASGCALIPGFSYQYLSVVKKHFLNARIPFTLISLGIGVARSSHIDAPMYTCKSIYVAIILKFLMLVGLKETQPELFYLSESRS